MDPGILIKEMQARGLAMEAVDGHIYVWPRDRITEELRALIKANKAALVDFLDHWQERAAIMEFDAGMSRQEAEAGAFEDCKVIWLERYRM